MFPQMVTICGNIQYTQINLTDTNVKNGFRYKQGKYSTIARGTQSESTSSRFTSPEQSGMSTRIATAKRVNDQKSNRLEMVEEDIIMFCFFFSVFENAIRTYAGDDPLDNWYNYISWVEQSYPKHGHEGNIRALIEDCLTKFEHNKQYINDQRFCKLWIKFVSSASLFTSEFDPNRILD